jgi:hypothetical protein
MKAKMEGYQMNKFLKVLSLCLVFFILIVSTAYGTNVITRSEFDLTADTSVQKHQLEIYKQMKSMVHAEAGIHFGKLQKTYSSELQEAVQQRNQTIDDKIMTVIQEGSEGEYSTAEIKHSIDKLLLWFFYDEMTFLLDEKAFAFLQDGNKEQAKIALEQAIELYLGSLYHIAGEQDLTFKTETQKMINTVLIPSLLQSLDKENGFNFNMYSQMFESSLLKVFVTALMQYTEQIQDGQLEDNKSASLGWQKGAYYVFLPIQETLMTENDMVLKTINAWLSEGKPELTKKESMELHLTRAINRKINESVNVVFKEIVESDQSQVLRHSAEAISLASVLELFIRNNSNIGTEGYEELQRHGEAFLNAMHQDHPKEGKAHAYQLLKLVSKLNGIDFEIGNKSLWVNGEEIIHKQASSFIDQETNRAVASARFFGEALGAEVHYIKESDVLLIKQGETIIEIKINSQALRMNGKPSSVKLEQPVILREGRAYLPIRTLAALFGCKVYWFEGKVIIN